MNYKKLLLLINIVFITLWMAFIFNMSSKPANESNQLSKGVTQIVVEVVEKVKPHNKIDINNLNHIIRKNAHFISYLILSILLISLFTILKINIKKQIIYSLLICSIYSISDEIHQLFVPGRGSQVGDVCIDICGALCGVIIWLAVKKIYFVKFVRR